MQADLNLIISRDKKLIGPINVTFTDAHVMKFHFSLFDSSPYENQLILLIVGFRDGDGLKLLRNLSVWIFYHLSMVSLYTGFI